ncbi:SDR family NAD(P)-dependent oxidoreductase [Rhodococcus wratislaviensis]|uniref:SDR family NAD(P)-dependent oxidoreductase n=1 Tax=Rhodococcus wratislaviensis TaxID=44752 RepID=UPI0035178829
MTTVRASVGFIGFLAGQTVLITGASRGIGAATARVVHRDGGTVILHYGSNTVATKTLAAELGTCVHLVQGDLTDSADTRAVWDESVRLAGRVDVLVNNAGAWIESPIDDDAAWETGWSRNLTAPTDLSRYAINHFRAHGGGSIVNVASRSSHRGHDAEHLAYGAAKGALLALTRGIARGYARENILADAVAPGCAPTSPMMPYRVSPAEWWEFGEAA